MQINKSLTTCFITLWLTSCTSISNNPAPQNTNQTWGTRVTSVSTLQNWDLKAVIGIRNNVKNDNVTANLQWNQTQHNYTILLFGPLGAGSAKLTGTPGHVTLEASDGKVYNAPTAERLLAEQTNWDIPVSNLYYWVRGLPVPKMAAIKKFDTFNHLTELQQQGWQIQFLRYTSINHIDVPDKISLSNSQMNVKIVIKEWKI